MVARLMPLRWSRRLHREPQGLRGEPLSTLSDRERPLMRRMTDLSSAEADPSRVLLGPLRTQMSKNTTENPMMAHSPYMPSAPRSTAYGYKDDFDVEHDEQHRNDKE